METINIIKKKLERKDSRSNWNTKIEGLSSSLCTPWKLNKCIPVIQNDFWIIIAKSSVKISLFWENIVCINDSVCCLFPLCGAQPYILNYFLLDNVCF